MVRKKKEIDDSYLPLHDELESWARFAPHASEALSPAARQDCVTL